MLNISINFLTIHPPATINVTLITLNSVLKKCARKRKRSSEERLAWLLDKLLHSTAAKAIATNDKMNEGMNVSVDI